MKRGTFLLKIPADDETLDLRGPFHDLKNLTGLEVSGYGVLVHETVTAVNLEGVARQRSAISEAKSFA